MFVFALPGYYPPVFTAGEVESVNMDDDNEDDIFGYL